MIILATPLSIDPGVNDISNGAHCREVHVRVEGEVVLGDQAAQQTIRVGSLFRADAKVVRS